MVNQQNVYETYILLYNIIIYTASNMVLINIQYS